MSQGSPNPEAGATHRQQRPDYSALQVFVLAFVVPLAYAAYTNHAWEDWYITFRAAKNLALGNGLVFTVGERVHTFTSPLGTLVPALLSYVTGNVADDLVLWLYRLINCALLGAAAVNLLAILRQTRSGLWPSVFALGMLILDAKLVDFSINGMETAFMAYFLTLAIRAHTLSFKRLPLVLGLAWGGLMWTRPDSVIYIAALACGFLAFPYDREQPRTTIVRQYCIAGLIALAAYGPWMAWAWSYYGSFVPHTVVAKGLNPAGNAPWIQETFWSMLIFPFASLSQGRSLDEVFAPSYALVFGGWPDLIVIGRVFAWICVVAWLLPLLRPVTRALSVAALLAHLYLSFVVKFVFPWYVPSVTIITVIVLALLMDQALSGGLGVLQRPVALTLLASTSALTLCTAYQLAVQQTVVEGNRKRIGLWLKENSASNRERVFLEPLGYIGFFSNLKMYDFPGLSSPEVVAARRALRTDSYAELIAYLKPEWLVLRPREVQEIDGSSPVLLKQAYTVANVFDVSRDVDSFAFLPGRDYLKFDQTFVVYRRSKTM